MTVNHKAIWNRVASDYDEFVTFGHNKLIHQFIKKESEILIDIIKKQRSEISLIEIGCGTGRVLFNLVSKKSINKKIKYLIGIDNAKTMIDISKQKLSITSHAIQNKVLFLHMEGSMLNKTFGNGRLSSLPAKYDSNDHTSILKKSEYDASKKIVCVLLNTLGSMSKSERITTVKNMIDCAGKDGMIIVSVFNGENFTKNSRAVYDSLKTMIHNSTYYFDDKKHEFTTNNGYFSHWFEVDEIKKIMHDAECTDVKLKKIGDVAIFLIGKR